MGDGPLDLAVELDHQPSATFFRDRQVNVLALLVCQKGRAAPAGLASVFFSGRPPIQQHQDVVLRFVSQELARKTLLLSG